MFDIIAPPKRPPISEFDRFAVTWSKGIVYFQHSWAGMRSPGPFKTLYIADTIGM